MVAPDPLADYAGLRRSVEGAGFHTNPEPLRRIGDRLVCASQQDQFGLSGVSFWVAKRGDAWFLAAWGGSIYRLPPGAAVETVVLDILREHRGTPLDFDAALKLKHSLRRVSEEDFDAMSPPT